jgi:membrane protein DedA with SNARE-associated domain
LISLTSLHAGSPISYAIAVILPLFDAVFPALPAETAIVTLGVTTAGTTDARIALLVACAAAGAFAGDNLGYYVGRRFGPAVERRFFSSPRGVRQRARAEHWLARFGMTAIIACRFVPGGRTAVTLSCGLIGFPRRRFIPATAAAAVIWAAYSFFLGRLGGHAFEHNPWAGLAVALGTTVVLAGLMEAARRIVIRLKPGQRDAAAPDHDARRNRPAGTRCLARPGGDRQAAG